LPESARAYFEPHFRDDFNQVRVHTDAKAAEATRAVDVRAFTVDGDVVCGQNTANMCNAETNMSTL